MRMDGRLTSKEVSEALKDNGIDTDALKWSPRVHARADAILNQAERDKAKKGRPVAVWCVWTGHVLDELHDNEHNFCTVFHRSFVPEDSRNRP